MFEGLARPLVEKIGALEINAFLPRKERQALAGGLNTLLASPTFASWREGATLDVAEWLTPKNGQTPGVILNVAHLDDEELVLGVVLEKVLACVRTLSGSRRLGQCRGCTGGVGGGIGVGWRSGDF